MIKTFFWYCPRWFHTAVSFVLGWKLVNYHPVSWDEDRALACPWDLRWEKSRYSIPSLWRREKGW